MKTETSQAMQPGDKFHMGQITCTITQVTSFSGSAHYGFIFTTDDGKLSCGFMPVLFVEKFSGHFPTPERA